MSTDVHYLERECAPHPAHRDIMYLASFLDGREREIIDEIAAFGIDRAALNLGISVKYVKWKAPHYLRKAYRIMNGCVADHMTALGIDELCDSCSKEERRERFHVLLGKIASLENDLRDCKKEYRQLYQPFNPQIEV